MRGSAAEPRVYFTTRRHVDKLLFRSVFNNLLKAGALSRMRWEVGTCSIGALERTAGVKRYNDARVPREYELASGRAPRGPAPQSGPYFRGGYLQSLWGWRSIPTHAPMIPTTTEPHRARYDYDTSSGCRWTGGKDPSVRQADSAGGNPSELRGTGKCAGRARRLCATMGAVLPQDLLVDPD